MKAGTLVGALPQARRQGDHLNDTILAGETRFCRGRDLSASHFTNIVVGFQWLTTKGHNSIRGNTTYTIMCDCCTHGETGVGPVFRSRH